MRISVTLPESLVADLDYLAKRMGATRSAVLTMFAQKAIGNIRKVVQETLPDQPTEGDLKRFRGKSAELLVRRMQGLAAMMEGEKGQKDD